MCRQCVNCLCVGIIHLERIYCVKWPFVKLAIRGDSRSFWVSGKATKDYTCNVYNYIIDLAWFSNLRQKPGKSMISVAPLSFDGARKLPHVSTNLLPETIVAIARIYLHPNYCSELRKTHCVLKRLHSNPSRSSKDVNFGINRKHV